MNIIVLINLLTLFIFTDLISSVNSQAPDQQNNQDNSISTGNPGISSCGYFGNIEPVCSIKTLPVGDLPKECTSIFFQGLSVDESYNICNVYGEDNRKMFDDVLKPKTLPVYVYYGHLTSSEWMTFLDNIESQVENEALALKAYFDEHPGITGLVLQHIDIFEVDFPTLNNNLILYIKTLKKHIPNLQIGLRLEAGIIQIYSNPILSTEIDFTRLNPELNFYVVAFPSFFNSCGKDNRIGGVVPVDGSADNTMTKVQAFLDKAKIPQKQLYFQYESTVSTIDEDPDFLSCHLTYQRMCTEPKATSNWCADTSTTLFQKGNFTKTHGAGFIAADVDLNDPAGCCCGKPFPLFHYLLDGWNSNVAQQKCPLFDRQ